jgi:hypothetical protein
MHAKSFLATACTRSQPASRPATQPASPTSCPLAFCAAADLRGIPACIAGAGVCMLRKGAYVVRKALDVREPAARKGRSGALDENNSCRWDTERRQARQCRHTPRMGGPREQHAAAAASCSAGFVRPLTRRSALGESAGRTACSGCICPQLQARQRADSRAVQGSAVSLGQGPGSALGPATSSALQAASRLAHAMPAQPL